ncbi:hypothetical protein MXB_3312 [Myxobolus squamalis]|nr:hypothetical protein MXB_3312 [Myxobolus squamalis]
MKVDMVLSPQLVNNLESIIIINVACGSSHTAALSIDGRVFTFGMGSYGQLGHGTNFFEHYPRQVIDLAGIEISTISCGSDHTLAYSHTLNKLYAFGSSHLSQCGYISAEKMENLPQIINISFQSYDLKNYVVESIVSGAYHNIILLKPIGAENVKHELVYPLPILYYGDQDCAVTHSDMMKISSLDNACQSQILHRLSKIFSSASCLNASFVRTYSNILYTSDPTFDGVLIVIT